MARTVLFSRSEVAAAIERDFEPVWVSVRAVPTVTIDFGGGRVVKRTLHGNVATLVVTPRGELVDAIPGVMTPRAYLDRLAQAGVLAGALTGDPRLDPGIFRRFHAASLATLTMPPANPWPDMGKAKVEDPTKSMLFPGKFQQRSGPADPLQRDTELNTGERRAQIHAKLAEVGLVRPATMVKWLYREVLHADLDDPYLGLGKLLFEGSALPQ
jgi:hypothetical protein